MTRVSSESWGLGTRGMVRGAGGGAAAEMSPYPNPTSKDDHDLVAAPLVTPRAPKGPGSSDQGQLTGLQLLHQGLQYCTALHHSPVLHACVCTHACCYA